MTDETLLKITFVILYMPSFYLGYTLYKLALFERFGKGELLFQIVCICIPLINCIILIAELFVKTFSDVEEPLKYYIKDLNQVRKCNECEISSRKWQFSKTDESKIVCPQCGSTGKTIALEDGRFPLAPKISTFAAIRRKRREKRMNRLEEEILSLEKYNNEILSYEQLQIKKLED